MTTLDISLPKSLKAFVDGQVQSSGYRDASADLRALIREDQKSADLRQVETLIVEAINSWERVVADDAFWQRRKEELRGKLGKKAAKSRKSAIRP